ncbi:SAM-dependent methyltransferase [Andreprevotia chitinilytica]|uniref:SAM-dependent methyltransferase n=1 Tax=Andreprevotia chitinilytica TaxID=396808 RepID=UPI000557991B|nr:cyclopropane-fatty-acyl-phospholipid synthase family protein [Andreprevotia chitinilytica]
MFWSQRFEQFVATLSQGSSLPLALHLWNGERYAFSPEPTVTLTLPSQSSLMYFWQPSLHKLGEAYVEGHLHIDGPPHDIFKVGVELASRFLKPTKRLRQLRPALRHRREQDAEAIRYHYDVSNAFYRLWLDRNMVYSCAYFEDGEETLDEAQEKKLDHILRKIQLKPGETLLDIGCGWGALILRAARDYGAKATGITLSEQQFELTQQRIHAAGLQHRCKVLLCDYRDMEGRFDKITSVGMFEHVGLKNLPAYFGKIHSLLKEGGLVLNHGITSSDLDGGDTPYGSADFIDRYVFPHGELPHVSLAMREMAGAGLEVVDAESLRRHYAKTLTIWAERFEANADQVRAIAGEKRYRIWRLYLAGCAWAFRNDWVSIYQLLGCKAGGPEQNPLPMSRGYQYES